MKEKEGKIFLRSTRNAWYLLPVTPETISFEDINRIITTELLSVGQVSQLGPSQLKQISFTSFFPEFIDEYVHTKIRSWYNEELGVNEEGDIRYLEPPDIWVSRIKRLMKEKVYVAILYPPVTGHYYISDFQHSLVGGEGGDIEYQLSLIEVRSSSTRSIDLGSLEEMVPQLTFAPFTKGDSTYIVRRGDTLTSIGLKTGHSTWALKHYNNITDASVDLREGGKIWLINKRPSNTPSPFAHPFVSRFS